MEDHEEKKANENAPKESPVKSKFTRTHETIDHQAEKEDGKQPESHQNVMVHRFSNAGTEQDAPKGKWCTGELLRVDEHGSVVDEDVTCPECLKVISEKKAADAVVAGDDPEPETDEPDDNREKNTVPGDSFETPTDVINDNDYHHERVRMLEKREQAIALQQAEVEALENIAGLLSDIGKSLEKLTSVNNEKE